MCVIKANAVIQADGSLDAVKKGGKMRVRNVVAFLMILCLLTMALAACAAQGDPAAIGTPQSSGNPAGNDEDPGNDEEEIVTIKYYVADGGTTTEPGPVEDAINALTEEKIGVHVDFVRIARSDFNTQTALAIANGEQVDIIGTSPMAAGSFLNLYATNQLMDITDLLEEYGQGIKALFSDDMLKATSIDGRLYAISCYRILNSNFYICFREDVLEQIGMEEFVEGEMKTWADYETVMQAIMDGTDMYGIGTGNKTMFSDPGLMLGLENIADSYTYDTLGDSMYFVWSDQAGNVEFLPERQEFIQMCKMSADWMEKGLLYPDSPYNQDGTETLAGRDVFGSFIVQSEYGVDVNKTTTVGKPMRCIEIARGRLSTHSFQKFGMAIAASSAEPEAAMKFLNLLYTDAELMNLITHGIENVNYVVNEEGEACYPEGKDGSSCGYHQNTFGIGNQFLCLPWDGDGTNFREESKKDFLNAETSAYCGLTIQTADYDTLVAGIYNIYNEYYPQLTCGYYTDALYQEYLEKLEAANIDEYIGLYQTAVAEFMD